MKTKIVLSGGTGLIGQNLAKAFKSQGYHVSNLSRNVNNSLEVLPFIDNHYCWGSGQDAINHCINGASAVINLAGASVSGHRWTGKYKKKILDSRLLSTDAIVEAINNSNETPKVLINASAVGYYGNQNDNTITEESLAGNDFLAKVCLEWENAAHKADDKLRVVTARIGIVMDKNGGALAKMLLPFNLFLGGPLGSSKQWMPWIHIDDIVNLFIFCYENENIKGAINFTSPNPVTMNEFAKVLGDVLNRPSLFKVPSRILKLLLGELSDIVLNGQKTVPKLALESGFKFKYPHLKGALESLLVDKYQQGL